MEGFAREAGGEGAEVKNAGSDGTVDESSRGVFQTPTVLMKNQQQSRANYSWMVSDSFPGALGVKLPSKHPLNPHTYTHYTEIEDMMKRIYIHHQKT